MTEILTILNFLSSPKRQSISLVPFTSTMHFALFLVYSLRRLPKPAAKIIACINMNVSTNQNILLDP